MDSRLSRAAQCGTRLQVSRAIDSRLNRAA
jgi:hypothetical protein